MTFSITELIQPSTIPIIPNEIPVFIGRSSRHVQESINFIPGSNTQLVLDLETNVIAMNIVATVCHWVDLIAPFDATLLSNGATFITVNSNIVKNLDPSRLIFAVSDAGNELLFSSPISKISITPTGDEVLTIILSTPLVHNPTQVYGSILGLVTEEIANTYNSVTQIVTLNFTPATSINGLSTAISKSSIEYDVLNTFNFLVIDSFSDEITESNLAILYGINTTQYSVVIPAHSNNDVSRVIDLLNTQLNVGYYLVPINMPDLFNLAITNFADQSQMNIGRRWAAIVPSILRESMTVSSGVEYVEP